MKPACINQFAPQVCQCDAVGNETFAIQHVLASAGVQSRIFCDRADAAIARGVHRWRDRTGKAGTALMVHYSHGSPSHLKALSAGGPKILVYHNVTPASYFVGTAPAVAQASRLGSADLPHCAERVEVALAHSSFSARDLQAAGFPRVEVLPYILFEPLYATEPDQSVRVRYAEDGWRNLLAVGRIAPHKCLEDSIFLFDYFKRHIERRSRLFIVGSWDFAEAYHLRLQRLVSRLNVKDIIFTGPVRQTELIAYYRLADAFLCMSEHEGFGVPVVEAMRYDVPVLAYASSAIPETLRGAGILFSEKNWPVMAESIGLLLSRSDWREEVIARQRQEVEHYSFTKARERLMGLLHNLAIG